MSTEYKTYKEAFDKLQEISDLLPKFITEDKEQNFTINIANNLDIKLNIEISDDGNISIKPETDFTVDNQILELVGSRTFETNNPDVLIKLIKHLTDKNNSNPFDIFMEYYYKTPIISSYRNYENEYTSNCPKEFQNYTTVTNFDKVNIVNHNKNIERKLDLKNIITTDTFIVKDKQGKLSFCDVAINTTEKRGFYNMAFKVGDTIFNIEMKIPAGVNLDVVNFNNNTDIMKVIEDILAKEEMSLMDRKIKKIKSEEEIKSNRSKQEQLMDIKMEKYED